MLNKLKKSKQEGFTIIEVLIVLAIAGLIILIVLLAIPALQRNGRNTGLKSDAGALAGGVSDFASTNDGAIAKAADSDDATAGTVILGSGTLTDVTAKVQAGTDVVFRADGTITDVTPDAGTLVITFKTKCGTATDADTHGVIASARSSSIVYQQETSGSALNVKCLDA